MRYLLSQVSLALAQPNVRIVLSSMLYWGNQIVNINCVDFT